MTMRTFNGQAVHLDDYTPAAFKIDTIHLDIRLDPEQTVVIATMTVERNEAFTGTPVDTLVLDGEDLALDFVSINGVDLLANHYVA
ncbi:MAG: hypothetical protein AAFW47_04215, partial [Pseudomonadota bacterium]